MIMEKDSTLFNWRYFALRIALMGAYIFMIGSSRNENVNQDIFDDSFLDGKMYYSPEIIEGKEDEYYDELIDPSGIKIGYIYIEKESDEKWIRERTK